MEGERDGDLIVPIISALLCVFVFTGGVFLVLYVFVPNSSQPWYPVVALILIGSPWIFWILTYMYTCIKHCCRSNNTRQISRRGSQGMSMAGTSTNNRSVSRNNATQDSESQVNSPNSGAKHVHFGQVVVMEGDERKGGHDESISSSKEIEMPLNTAPLS